MDLGRLLAPTSVAVVGATERPGAYGSEALLNLERIGYEGRVYAVNPARERVHGVACHPDLAALPEAPDAVVVAIPAPDVPPVVESAGACGCGGAVVFAAGFAEAPGGAALQDSLVGAARRHELPVCGPNGNGIVGVAGRVALWGDMVAPVAAGSVALVSQSGNVAVNALASRRGLRLHTVVSCGNQAVLSAEDYLEALAVRDGVRSVALYLEHDGDGARWCDALERCARAGIGVAVLKAGTTEAGAAAAQAHTGAVAGDQAAFRAFVEECGAAWATDPHELLELAKTLAVHGRARGGVAVMTCSGGDSSVAADLADELGAELPALAGATVARLAELLPAAATAQNPLDYTSLLWDEPDALAGLVGALGADPAVGRVLVLYDQPAGLDGAAAESWEGVLDGVRKGAAEHGVRVLVGSTLPELLDDETAAGLQRDGIAAVAGLRSGLRCAAAVAGDAPDPQRIAAIREGLPVRSEWRERWLAEHDTKALLRAGGVDVPDGEVAADPDEAVAVADRLGGPVVLKLSGPALQHKSERGAVLVGVEGEREIRNGARRLLMLPEGDEATLLVEQVAPGGAELLVAVRTDTIVPVLVVGLGGLWTEAFDDVRVLALPVTPECVEVALRDLRAAGVLTGGRGHRPLDIGAAARLAVRASEVALEQGLHLLELNPVIVSERSAVAVDALAVVPSTPTGDPT